MTKLNTLSYVYGQNDTIETGEELLESGAIAVYQDGEEHIVDFEIIETDENDILQTVVRVTSVD